MVRGGRTVGERAGRRSRGDRGKGRSREAGKRTKPSRGGAGRARAPRGRRASDAGGGRTWIALVMSERSKTCPVRAEMTGSVGVTPEIAQNMVAGGARADGQGHPPGRRTRASRERTGGGPGEARGATAGGRAGARRAWIRAGGGARPWRGRRVSRARTEARGRGPGRRAIGIPRPPLEGTAV